MEYYTKIASWGKSELIKEAHKNMKKLDKLGIQYKKGQIFDELKKKLHIQSLKLEDMNGDTLYLLNIQLDILITKAERGELKCKK